MERAALQGIAQDYAAAHAGLAAIIPELRVVRRENTSSGFIADLAAVGQHARLTQSSSPIGVRLYALDGYGEPFGVTLFIRDGYPALLDCHVFGPADTRRIDFAAVAFRPWSDRD